MTRFAAMVGGALSALAEGAATAVDGSPAMSRYQVLRRRDLEVLRALLPAALGLPEEPSVARLQEALSRFDSLVAVLAEDLRGDILLLLDLLGHPLTRRLLGLGAPWPEARAGDIQTMLRSWSLSILTLKRFAYQSLTQLCQFSWYGIPAVSAELGFHGEAAAPRVFATRGEVAR